MQGKEENWHDEKSKILMFCLSDNVIRATLATSWSIVFFHNNFAFPGNVCHICNKSVAKLKYHMEDIHFPVRTPCPICGKVFSSTNKMRTHKSSVHTKAEKAAAMYSLN